MSPTIHILLATYQGAAHLPEQLRSIEQQSLADWHLWASDDGSTDATAAILQAFQRKYPGKTTLLKGPEGGVARNFWSLLQAVMPYTDNDLFAFCDQDDVWFADKLERAAQWHTQQSERSGMSLYCARTQITNAQLEPTSLSPLPRHTLGLRNALIENIASGNTMVFNLPLLQTLRLLSAEHMVLHDWSAYLTATACGGTVYFDRQPCLWYRQHATNVVGAHRGWPQYIKKLASAAQGRYRAWGDATEGALRDLAPKLTAESRALVEAFGAVRHHPHWLQRLRKAIQARLVRQRPGAQVAFWVSVCMGWV